LEDWFKVALIKEKRKHIKQIIQRLIREHTGLPCLSQSLLSVKTEPEETQVVRRPTTLGEKTRLDDSGVENGTRGKKIFLDLPASNVPFSDNSHPASPVVTSRTVPTKENYLAASNNNLNSSKKVESRDCRV
jgi:hypothetical protein